MCKRARCTLTTSISRNILQDYRSATCNWWVIENGGDKFPDILRIEKGDQKLTLTFGIRFKEMYFGTRPSTLSKCCTSNVELNNTFSNQSKGRIQGNLANVLASSECWLDEIIWRLSDWSIRIRIWRVVWLSKYRFSSALLDLISIPFTIFSLKKPKIKIFLSLNLVNMLQSIFQNWRNCRCEIDKTLLTYQNIHQIFAVQIISSNLQNRSLARPNPCHLREKYRNSICQ